MSEDLGTDNFLDIIKSDKLEDLITNIRVSKTGISLLKICDYILTHKREWNNVVKEIVPQLREYDLADRDYIMLNEEGETLIIEAILYEIQIEEWQEERQIKGW